MKIAEMDETWIGQLVTFHPRHRNSWTAEDEQGRVKSFNNDTQTAFVVYGLDAKGDSWANYTAAATNYIDIAELWS